MSVKFRGNNIFTTIKDFERQKQIGVGAFSKVFLAIYKPTGKKYALKQINLKKLKNTHEENIQKEIEIHKKLDFSNIIKFYDVFQNKQFLYLVLEYLEGGNLFSHMRKTSQLDLKSVKKYFSQCLKAINYLHIKGIVLRDLKPENILLTRDKQTIKICDFGWASYINDKRWLKKKAGTYVYMAPEALNGHLQGFETDIWALGILLFEMLYDREPYPGNDCRSVSNSIKIGIDFRDRNIGEDLKSLILDILQIRMDRRISIDNLNFRFNEVIKNEINHHHKRVYSSNYSQNQNTNFNYFGNHSNISNILENKNIGLKENKTFYKEFPKKYLTFNDYKKKYSSIDKLNYHPQSQKIINLKHYSINKKKTDSFLNLNLKKDPSRYNINKIDCLKNSENFKITEYLNNKRKNSNEDYLKINSYHPLNNKEDTLIKNLKLNRKISKNTNNSLICGNEKKFKKSIKKYDINENYLDNIDKLKKNYSIDGNHHKNSALCKNVSIDNFSTLKKNKGNDYLMSPNNYLLKDNKKMISFCLNINENMSSDIFNNYKLNKFLNEKNKKFESEKSDDIIQKRKKKLIKINKREDCKTFSSNDFQNLNLINSNFDYFNKKNNYPNNKHIFSNKEIIYHKLKESNNNLKTKLEEKNDSKKKSEIKKKILNY